MGDHQSLLLGQVDASSGVLLGIGKGLAWRLMLGDHCVWHQRVSKIMLPLAYAHLDVIASLTKLEI